MNLNRRSLLTGGLAAGLTAAAGSTVASAATRSSGSSYGPVRTIGLEEHCLPEAVADLWHPVSNAAFGGGGRGGARGNRPQGGGNQAQNNVNRRLGDFEGERLEFMDRAGMQMAVLSLSVNGPQGQPDVKLAHDMMVRGNDALAQEVSKHPDRFAGFACLSMHDVDATCREYERCINELKFVGVLLNNWQRAGANGEACLTYDDRRYDEFWDTVQRLEAPVYLHPGWSPPWYGWGVAGMPAGLDISTWNWAYETGTHALRIIISGVFDRYPNAQLILGHNGEHIVTDLWRIEDRLHDGFARDRGEYGGTGNNALPYSAMKVTAANYQAERTVTSYFRTNVTVTTAGQFNDAGLQHVIAEIGADRVLFSTDYPWEDMVEGGKWFNAAPLSDKQRHAIARGNHLQLLKRLPLKA